MHRVIRGLTEAEPCPAPHGANRGRGAKALGRSYERALARTLPWAKQGLWFRFRDANGVGHCQPDFVADLDGVLLVLEAKLTWVPWARDQILDLYSPVLQHLTGVPVLPVVVVKNLTRGSPEASPTLQEALASGLWHFPFPSRSTIAKPKL